MRNEGLLRVPTGTPKPAPDCSQYPGHTVQLYRSDEYLINDLRRWASPVLEGGDSAVIIATASHRAALAELLRTDGQDLKRASDEGRYIELDAAETLGRLLRNGWP